MFGSVFKMFHVMKRQPRKMELLSRFSNQRSTSLLKRQRESYNGDSNSSGEDYTDVSEFKKSKCTQNILIVTASEMNKFLELLDDDYISDFLSSDVCLLYSDKYLLAMVFAYFKRANLALFEYTKLNFFLALFLANDVEEDEEDYKYEIFPWALGDQWRKNIRTFLLRRNKLWARMDYRAVVSSKCCEEIMEIRPLHWAWSRNRLQHHAEAIRACNRSDDYLEPRGPMATPRGPCDRCACIDMSSLPDSTSWYLSSSSESSSEDKYICSKRCYSFRFRLEDIEPASSPQLCNI